MDEYDYAPVSENGDEMAFPRDPAQANCGGGGAPATTEPEVPLLKLYDATRVRGGGVSGALGDI